ncbi:MAG: acyl-CoA dehydrogenase family protein [Gemmatimonadetes bacterium]|nr:acyl-CoA dehydrogenase family protein [Gemmatimonadota bacterium]
MRRYLNDGHLRLRDRVRSFAEARIAPIARELDEKSRFPWETVREMAEMGLLGVTAPRELGGLGLDFLSYVLVVEELARVDASHSITVAAHTGLCLSPIMSLGDDDQKRLFVPPLAKGEVIGGFGLSEPGSGSDVAAMTTRARREGDSYSISGAKIFITHAGVGQVMVVTAVTDPEAGARSLSTFVVCKHICDDERAAASASGWTHPTLPRTAGVVPGVKDDKMGWRASDTRELFFDNVRVPAEFRLGAEGAGLGNALHTLTAGRIAVAALSLGLAQGALDVAAAYATRREQFGRKIIDFQQVGFRLADLATEIEAGRHLTYHAAWLKDRGHPFEREASMAKLFCSELAMRAAHGAIQTLGAAGYTSDHPVERIMRDAKVCEIGEGTSEIQRLILSRLLTRETTAILDAEAASFGAA